MNFDMLCKNARWTNTALAKKLGISRQTAAAWRKGTSIPKSIYITPIAQLLGVTESDVLKSFER